jgi:hypothetical protein
MFPFIALATFIPSIGLLLTVHKGAPVVGVLALLAVGVTLSYTGTNAGALDQLLGSFGAYVDQELAGTQIVSTAGPTAITITHGKVIVTYAGVAAMTLATPTAGSPAGGGNDAQALKIIDASGHAHTLTLSANVINGNKHVLTSAGNIGDDVTLTAYNAQYLVSPTTTAWALS